MKKHQTSKIFNECYEFSMVMTMTGPNPNRTQWFDRVLIMFSKNNKPSKICFTNLTTHQRRWLYNIFKIQIQPNSLWQAFFLSNSNPRAWLCCHICRSIFMLLLTIVSFLLYLPWWNLGNSIYSKIVTKFYWDFKSWFHHNTLSLTWLIVYGLLVIGM